MRYVTSMDARFAGSGEVTTCGAHLQAVRARHERAARRDALDCGVLAEHVLAGRQQRFAVILVGTSAEVEQGVSLF